MTLAPLVAERRLRSDRKFRISPLEGATERSNESESFGPNHHVRGRIKDELKVYQIAVPKHDILGNGELKHRDRGSVIATEGSEFPEEEYEPPEVVIHDEAVFKEEGARTEFIIIDLVDLRAESNAQEVELAHQYITYNVYGAEIELRNEFRSA